MSIFQHETLLQKRKDFKRAAETWPNAATAATQLQNSTVLRCPRVIEVVGTAKRQREVTSAVQPGSKQARITEFLLTYTWYALAHDDTVGVAARTTIRRLQS